MEKKIAILICFFVALFFKCEDFLREEPKSFIAKTNFYQTEDDALSALTAVYATMGEGFFPATWLMSLVENRADHSNGRGSQQNISIYDQPLDEVNQGRVFGVYNSLYKGINRANVVLDNIDQIDMDETLKAQYLAEARFLRAYFYSILVKYWGGVPIRTNEFTDISQVAVPRATALEVWDLVISDLEQAIPDLSTSFPESQSGRATSWAAKMLLADTYLNLEEWSFAADLAEDVIENGPYSLMEVQQPDDFLQMYGPLVNTYPEDIWSVHYSETNGHVVAQYIHRYLDGGYTAGGGVYAWLPVMASYLGDWDTNDMRREFNLYEYIVNGTDTVFLPGPSPLFRKYRDPLPGSNKNNIPIFRLAEAYLIYAEASSQANNGPGALALERLNIVRRRGYGMDPYNPSTVDYAAGLSQTAFRDSVLQERAYEFVLEMKRWNDLLRTGTAQEVIEATGKEWNDVSLLFPIPLDEINNNPAITNEDQNPGY